MSGVNTVPAWRRLKKLMSFIIRPRGRSIGERYGDMMRLVSLVGRAGTHVGSAVVGRFQFSCSIAVSAVNRPTAQSTRPTPVW